MNNSLDYRKKFSELAYKQGEVATPRDARKANKQNAFDAEASDICMRVACAWNFGRE
jgi:hypothetical protein